MYFFLTIDFANYTYAMLRLTSVTKLAFAVWFDGSEMYVVKNIKYVGYPCGNILNVWIIAWFETFSLSKVSKSDLLAYLSSKVGNYFQQAKPTIAIDQTAVKRLPIHLTEIGYSVAKSVLFI